MVKKVLLSFSQDSGMSLKANVQVLIHRHGFHSTIAGSVLSYE